MNSNNQDRLVRTRRGFMPMRLLVSNKAYLELKKERGYTKRFMKNKLKKVRRGLRIAGFLFDAARNKRKSVNMQRNQGFRRRSTRCNKSEKD